MDFYLKNYFPQTSPAFNFFSQVRFKLLNFSYVHANHEQWRTEKIFPKPYNTLYFILDGDGFIQDKNGITQLKKNHAYLLPVNHFISYSCKTFIKKFWMNFELELFPGIDIFSEVNATIELGEHNLSNNPTFQNHLKNDQFEDYLYIQSYAYSLLSSMPTDIYKTLENQSDIFEHYKDVFEYILKNLSAIIRVQELAELMNMSPASFSRAFTRDIGVTPKKLLNTRLNRKACNLLLRDNGKMKDLACELQFEDEYYFFRFFKKMNGISPSQYREIHQFSTN